MLSKEFSFELIAQDDKARLGKIYTSRGIIDTPAFMPVGTQGTVKGIFTDGDLRRTIQGKVDIHKTHISDTMTSKFKYISSDKLVTSALSTMQEFKITAIFVLEKESDVKGIIHIHDIIAAGLT